MMTTILKSTMDLRQVPETAVPVSTSLCIRHRAHHCLSCYWDAWAPTLHMVGSRVMGQVLPVGMEVICVPRVRRTGRDVQLVSASVQDAN